MYEGHPLHREMQDEVKGEMQSHKEVHGRWQITLLIVQYGK